MAFSHIIPWYGIYSRAVDAVWLTTVVLRHAAVFADLAEQSLALKEAENQREVLQFEACNGNGSDDDSSVHSEGTVDSSASITAHRCLSGDYHHHIRQCR